jgi:GNAT superfamily N-acetyltransferase
VAGLDGPGRAVGGLAVRPPAGVELQPASRDDLAIVLRLLGERESLAAQLSAEAARDRWERVIGSVDASPFLAIAEGEAAGLLLLSFRRRLNFATWEGWVPELVVARTFRGRGIGRALLRVAIEEWRLRGAHRLSVETEPVEDGCGAMLTGLGFEEGLLRFRHDHIAPEGRPPPPGVTIRPIQATDFGSATRLVAEMGVSRSPAPERMDALERSFGELTARHTDASLVAQEGDHVIGICTLELRETLRSESPESWVPELVVTEPARGRAIGAALLDAAMGEAQRRGAQSMTLESGPMRGVAHALYRSRGFRDAGRERLLLRDRA